MVPTAAEEEEEEERRRRAGTGSNGIRTPDLLLCLDFFVVVHT